MKILLQHKIGVGLILSFSLALFLFSNCTGSQRGTEGVGTTEPDKDRKKSSSTQSTLSCDLIERCTTNNCECSGSDCCKDDEDCQDQCKDNVSNDGLKLSGAARETCFHLEEEVVKQLFKIIELLDKPKVEKLRDLGQDEDDMNLLCSAVKELDYDLLDDRIEDYSSTDAKRTLGWVSESSGSIDIFENAEDDKGIAMFKRLLQKAGGDSNDNGILKGLDADVSVEDDDEPSGQQHIMRWALQSNNTELVRWINKEVITDSDEGLCGDDNKSNRPVSGDTTHDKDYGEAACVLGIYCKIASNDDSDDNDFRKEVAELIDNEVEVSDFIKEEAAQGGLKDSTASALSDWEDIAEEWGYQACEALNREWNNSSNDILDLF